MSVHWIRQVINEGVRSGGRVSDYPGSPLIYRVKSGSDYGINDFYLLMAMLDILETDRVCRHTTVTTIWSSGKRLTRALLGLRNKKNSRDEIAFKLTGRADPKPEMYNNGSFYGGGFGISDYFKVKAFLKGEENPEKTEGERVAETMEAGAEGVHA